MDLNGNTKIDDLLKEYPFLLDFLVARSPKFKIYQRMARIFLAPTVARF